MLLQIIFKFRGSETPFPALSTGHFNKYERKCKWLKHILPISSVVVKVQCSRKKSKTVTPSCLRLSSSLVTRWLRARRLLFRQAKDTNTMRKIYQLPLFNDKNAFRKSVYIYKNYFQLYARTYVRLWTLYAPGFYNLVDQSELDPVHASIIVLFSSEEMGVRLSSIYDIYVLF